MGKNVCAATLHLLQQNKDWGSNAPFTWSRLVGRGEARWVTARSVGTVMVWHGEVAHGKLCSGGLGSARCGLARFSRVWHVLVWRSRLGSVCLVRSGWVRWGVVWRSWLALVGHCAFRYGKVCFGGLGTARCGPIWLGRVWHGGRGLARFRTVSLGEAVAERCLGSCYG